ncbi:conserved hypothetical protein [Luminiphilus syltensis NOR5-1B]|uniref:Uncharacterized protein n=1 Tax=Luminiphilus syltensis NOR5-1B TaxID=565045 RepID=B8KYB2_9GAMM|nr:leucine-rich repeat domain-containing protein [Luminiphilus syltensis]EED36260.1 conserved hypothetical protein [Luminiphilus syltensis NOR5-1B]
MVRRIGILLLLSFLGGCSQYDVSINDTMVYEPDKLFADYDISDIALSECVAQAISDQNVTRIEQLTQLNCSNAGVMKLDGLRLFSGLQAVKLSDNPLRNLVELERLTLLTHLWLDNNQVVDPVPLRALKRLQTLDLRGNDSLQCPEQSLFPPGVEVTLPAHCTTP